MAVFEKDDFAGPRLYDTIEPNVIDETMLHKAVEEQGPKDEAGYIAKSEGIDFIDVTSLRLDFRNVLKIDNLWYFKNVTRLQLDNNILETIEGLEALTELIWLDLSFNNIEIIQGIDHLVKLQDLTLHNNRISKIENMDSLKKLEVLSLGKNQITEISDVLYLRRFKKLKTLSLAGNPIAEDKESYMMYVIAHLPDLNFLDYRLVDEDVKKTAHDKHYVSVEEILHDERAAQRKADEIALKESEFKRHKEAYVENLNGPQLFEVMYIEDKEGRVLNEMPGVEDVLEAYRDKFTAVCQQIFDFGLREQKKRQEEVNDFFASMKEAKEDNKTLGQKCINEFLDYKYLTFNEMQEIQENAALEAKLVEYNDRLHTLWDSLMGYEMQLVDQFEDAVKEFERNLGEMVAVFIEHVQGLTAQLRDMENQHQEKIMELAIVTLEKVLKNEISEDVSDDLREMFVDKDTVINAVTTSHDYHLLKIDNREDDMIQRIQSWMHDLIDTIHDTEEVERNRKRVIEICNFIDHLRDEIDNFDVGVHGY